MARRELEILETWLRLVGGPAMGDIVFVRRVSSRVLTHVAVCRSVWLRNPTSASTVHNKAGELEMGLAGQVSLIAREVAIVEPVVGPLDLGWGMETRREYGLMGGDRNVLIVANLLKMEPLQIGGVYGVTETTKPSIELWAVPGDDNVPLRTQRESWSRATLPRRP